MLKLPTYQELLPRVQRATRLVRPWESLLRPVFSGWEHIPNERPLLFVGNHTTLGVFDVPFLWAALFREKGIIVRGLGDRLHFHLPLWRDLIVRYGVAPASPEDCGQLLAQGETVLVFPGGAREVAKRKGERYQLIWKQRSGFARIAAQHRCTILPFASVGIEDMFDIFLDGDQILASPLGSVLSRLGVRDDVLVPLVIGKGPLGLPRLQRLYFHFAPPIPTHDVDPDDPDAIWQIRERTRLHIEESIQLLRQKQKQDPHRYPRPPF